MIRALWYLARLGVLIAAAVWVAMRPGTLNLDWQGYIVSLPVWVAALALAGLVVAIYGVTRLVLAVRAGPGWWRARRHHARREQGYRALTQGLVAVAAGDPRTASKLAARAQSLLRDPPLTLLLSAQAAQLSGDEGAAKRYFQAMLEQPDMAFLGLRGLLTQAMKTGDLAGALPLAEKAASLQPKAQWPLKTLLSLQARQGRWQAAEQSLDRLRALKALPAERVRRGQAALLLERSRQAQGDGQTALALSLAQQAHDLAPGLAPAAAHLARLDAAQGNPKAARRALAQAWRANPHPEIAALWADLGSGAAATPAPGDAAGLALARVQRLEALLKMDEDAGRPAPAAGRLALAQACLDARLWGLARRQIDRLADEAPSLAVYRLRALVVAGQTAGEAAAGGVPVAAAPADPTQLWALAADAPAEPAWTCGDCGRTTPDWSAVCPSCGGFDTLDWVRPGSPATTTGAPSPARWRRLLPGRRR